MTQGHNKPPVILELSATEAAFLLDNCEQNITFGLLTLDKLISRDLQEKMIQNLEFFKTIRTKLKNSS